MLRHCQAMQLLAHGVTLSHLLLAVNLSSPSVAELELEAEECLLLIHFYLTQGGS